jgi:hypothetical protein
MEDDNLAKRMNDRANEIEKRLKDQAKREARYEHRISAVGLTFVAVLVVVGLPSQNGWLAFIAALIAASLVNLSLKESHNIDDN